MAYQNRDHGDAGSPGAFPNAEVVGNPVYDVLALPLPQERLAGRDGPIRVLRSAVLRGES